MSVLGSLYLGKVPFGGLPISTHFTQHVQCTAVAVGLRLPSVAGNV